MPEDDVNEVEKKVQQYKKLKELMNQDSRVIASDIYIGAFLLQKRPGKVVPTSQTLYRYKFLQQPSETDLEAIKQAREACKKANALHWPFAFPKVFSKGGFDVVLGNPPWDMLQLDPREFFAQSHPDIANAQNMAKRDRLIEKLKDEDLTAYLRFKESTQQIEAIQNYIHCVKRFENSGIGRINLSSLFTETCIKLINIGTGGKAGIIVPSGISTDSFTQKLFSFIIDTKLLNSLYDFENQGIFPSVHNSYKFCLLTMGASPSADFACFLHSIQELEDDRRHFELSADDFDLINPNTHTLPIFRSKMDAELTKKIYRRVPILIDESKGEDGNPWKIQFQLMFMMNTASSIFLDAPTEDSYPLYEAKMLHQYDHRWATYEPDGTVRDVTLEEKMNPDYEVTPRYWVPKKEVLNRIADVPDSVRKAWYAGEEHQLRIALAACEDEELNQLATADNLMKKMDQVMDQRSPKWLMGFRNISNSTNERTFIPFIFPRGGLGNSGTIIFGLNRENTIILAVNMSSLVFDFIVRQKVGGTNLNQFYVKQFPVIDYNSITGKVIDYITSRGADLMYTSRLMANSKDTQLHLWDPESRATYRAELDALYARLYGLNREELMYILDPESVMGKDYPSQTFPGLKNKEIREYGEYRTMRLVLEAWDRQERQPELWQ